ncbi:MAG TPA: hypothetical protein VFW11_04030 [Cyclobacteriaceae bacterium]|nr:hypothetical protein [Cyclobacteriaceae bacterium]
MKSTFFIVLLVLVFPVSYAQSLIGTWQLVKQTTCLNDELGAEDEETEELIVDMHSNSTGTNSVIRFKDHTSGEENVRIMDSRKSTKLNSFLYKFDGNNIYFLDKKSKLLLGSYSVENFTADSLIVSNASRPCETKIFVKISDKK